MKLPRIQKDRRYFLRVFRAQYDLTQGEAAKLFGLSPSHWSLLEAGERKPSPHVAKKLAAATGASLELLLGL
jgi:transcriptional regulator with XRE-family HTH domain